MKAHTSALASFLNGRVNIFQGDITLQKVDAIVNAANSSLLGGGGVDGAIHRAGGRQILAECREIRRRLPKGLPAGEAVITGGGLLPARFVIHTVGPVYGLGGESELLAACYRNSLALAAQHALQSIAFPAISTGVYGYPREDAAAVASCATEQFLSADESIVDVRMVFYSQNDADVFLRHHSFTSDRGRDR